MSMMQDYKDQNLKSAILFWTITILILIAAVIVL
jgi:hypothetical protein